MMRQVEKRKGSRSGGMVAFECKPFASLSMTTENAQLQRTTRKTTTPAASNAIFQLGAAATEPKLNLIAAATQTPVALLALVPKAVVLFGAGALSGAIAKTITAPLDRAKILLQVKGGLQQGAIHAAASKGNLIGSLIAIGKQEGIMGYWKGNLPQVLRVVPYSAAQLYSYELYKKFFTSEDGTLTVQRRLAAGALAGMTATLLTHPLDTLRLRIAVDPSAATLPGAVRVLLKEGSGAAFYRGLGASMIGIAPYMALELGSFDLLPDNLNSFARGFIAALIATVSCYPLDTVRRRIQLEATRRLPWQQAAGAIFREDGIGGFYRGFLPNALKNLPNKGVKLSVFANAKRLLSESEQALEDEKVRQGLIKPNKNKNKNNKNNKKK